MVMHNPQHTGEVIRELCISPLNLTVTDTAKGLGVSKKLFQRCLTVISESLLIWPFVCQWHLAAVLRAG